MERINLYLKLCVFLIIAFSFLLVSGCSYTENQNAMNESAPNGYNLNDLNNYGEWLHITQYGDVWRPYVVSDWMPFENGHWIYGDGDWSWISYEPFGWIVYHYGFWYNDAAYGWVWIPSDNSWSPARIKWIEYDDYIGWAPLPPPGVVYSEPWVTRASHYWEVIRKKDFDQEDVGNYRVKNPIRNMINGNGFSYTSPAKNIIETSTGRNIEQIKLRREDVTIHKKEFTRIILPPAEVEKVERNSTRIMEEVLIPREKYNAEEQQRSKNRG